MVSKLGGVNVWASGYEYTTAPWHGTLNYGSYITVQFVKPGTNVPATGGSVTVELINQGTAPVTLFAMGGRGQELADTSIPVGTGPHGGELLTLTAPGISGFTLGYSGQLDSGYATVQDTHGPWGIAEIEFTPSPSSAPEPCGLALAVVGAAAIAGRGLRKRSLRPVAAP